MSTTAAIDPVIRASIAFLTDDEIASMTVSDLQTVIDLGSSGSSSVHSLEADPSRLKVLVQGIRRSCRRLQGVAAEPMVNAESELAFVG